MRKYLIILFLFLFNIVYSQSELGMNYSELIRKENTNIKEVYKYEQGAFIITNNFTKNSKIIYELNTIECIMIYIVPNTESAYEYYKEVYSTIYKGLYEINFYEGFLTI